MTKKVQMRNVKHNKEYWEKRCAELEVVLEDCSQALALVPVGALEAGKQWFPSEIAVHLLRRAKESVLIFSQNHWNIGNGI